MGKIMETMDIRGSAPDCDCTWNVQRSVSKLNPRRKPLITDSLGEVIGPNPVEFVNNDLIHTECWVESLRMSR